MIRSATLLALLTLLGAAPAALAQNARPGGPPGPGGALAGRVLDAESGEAIATAAVAVWRAADSSLVTGAITDAEGRFEVDRLRPGAYSVEVSFLGYVTERRAAEVTPGAPRADLGEIRLAADTERLGEVEVAAEREFVQVEVDRTVYNVRDQPVAQSGTAADVLRTLPSLEVDQDGNVSLRGNQNVAVMINGRSVPMTGQALAAFLQQMPASSIERVEVIPNPSAKYDPEGMGGLLNIVLKQDAELGLSGGVIAGLATNDGYNASANVNYQRGRVTTSFSYGYRREERGYGGFSLREDRYQAPVSFLTQDDDGANAFDSHLLNGSVDYKLTDRTNVGLTGVLSVRGMENATVVAYAIGPDTLAAPDLRYDRRSEGARDGLNADLALTLGHAWEPQRHTLNAEARLNRAADEQRDAYLQQVLDPNNGGPADARPLRERTDRDDTTTEGTLQLDYVRPALAGAKLEAGYKGTLRRLDNALDAAVFDYDAGAFVDDPARTNAFDYEERVHAAYLTLGRSVGRFDLQAGLRVERTATDFTLSNTGEAFEDAYTSAFPSAFATFNLAEGRQLKATYSKRINRPPTFLLNPFPTYTDPLNLFRGNPYLRPEFTHSFELGYTQFAATHSLTLTPYFRHATDVIRRLKTIDDAGVSTTSFENFDTSDSYGVEAIATARPRPWLNGMVSLNAFKVVTEGGGTGNDLGNDAFGWMARANATVTLPQGLDLQATYFYRAPLDVEQGRISAFQMLDLSLRKKLLDEKASLTLRVSDPFDQMGFNFRIDDARFLQRTERDWESRVATLTFTYNFGRPPRQQPRPRPGDQPQGGGMDVGIQ